MRVRTMRKNSTNASGAVRRQIPSWHCLPIAQASAGRRLTGGNMGNSAQIELRDLQNMTHFDKWSANYDGERISRWFQYTQRLAISFLHLEPGSKVLDVGCGTGYAVMHLASILPNGKVYGIDISQKMIQQADAKVPVELKSKIEFRQASSANIPYPDGEFDHVICTNSFHHYPDPLHVLSEMYRVIRPRGQVVILENATDMSWYTWAWDHLLRIMEKGHVRYYSSRELGEMLKQAHFKHVRLCHLKNEFLTYGKLFASIQVWAGSKAPMP